MSKSTLSFGIEKSQIISIAARSSHLVSGFITMILVGFHFDLNTQGYFYAFNSLIALQVFVEMGLSMILIQFSSHEMAKLHWNDGIIIGDANAKSRLRSLLHFSLAWFSIAAILLIIVLIPGGEWFFNNTVDNGKQIPTTLLSSWSFLVITTSANLMILPLFNIIEGCGKVSEVSSVRLLQYIAGGIAAWLSIIFGFGLYALSVQNLLIFTIGLAYLLIKKYKFLIEILFLTTPHDNVKIKWKTEILPLQSRIAVSWISGYFAFQSLTLIVFSTQGSESAGRMGMTMQIFSAITSICIIFVSARISKFGQLISSNKIQEFDNLFFQSAKQSTIAFLLMAIFVIVALNSLTLVPDTRILPPTQIVILAISFLGSHVIYIQAIYLRTFKRELFMLLSIINGLLISTVSLLTTPLYGTFGAVGTYAIVTIFISLPLGTKILLRSKPTLSFKS